MKLSPNQSFDPVPIPTQDKDQGKDQDKYEDQKEDIFQDHDQDQDKGQGQSRKIKANDDKSRQIKYNLPYLKKSKQNKRQTQNTIAI